MRALIVTAIAVISCSHALAAEVAVTQKGKAFSVKKIDAVLGDTLVFKNEEAELNHNVYSLSSGNEFELKLQRPGQSDKIFLDPAKHKKGAMVVECAIHPTMKLEVNIK